MATMDSVKSDARDQIAQLRQQVEMLMNERITPAVASAAGRAQDYARTAGDMAREQGEAVSSRVREQPLIAIAIAGAVGFLLGRIFR